MALTMFLEKEGLRRLDETTMKVQLTRVIDRVLAGKRGNIWSFAGPIKIEEVERSSGICYRVKLRFRRVGRTAPAEVLARQWEYMVKIAADAGRGKGWHPVDGFDGDEDKLQDEEPMNGKVGGRHEKDLAPVELPADIKPWFQHLFERDAQIAMVQSAVTAYKESDYADRYHCCLWGPPGCLASDTFIRYVTMNKDGNHQDHKGGSIERLFYRWHGIIPQGKGNYQRKQSVDSAFYVQSVNDDDMIVLNRVTNVIDSGIKTVYRVTTESGKSIKTTNDHPFRTPHGYVKLLHLEPGDLIMSSPNKVKKQGGRRKPRYRPEVFVKYHPTAKRKVVNGITYYRLRRYHINYEAHQNGLSNGEYINLLNNGTPEEIDKLWTIPPGSEIHHKNDNPENNNIDNLVLVDSSTAHQLLYHSDSAKSRIGIYLETDAIVDIEKLGEQHVYDISMADPYRNFLANDIAVHNCGKSDILMSFERMMGADKVLRFNATSTSKAGAEKTLLESEYIPPIMIIEEVEKTEEKALRWLLDVLDHRAEIRKVNFRSSDYRSVKLLCLATVNNRPLFDNMLEGALSSRFAHKIKCPRPSRKALEMILRREVLRVDGDPAWIEPALDWCLDEEGTNDPRRVIAVCMCGRDKLLSGEYQEYLRQTTGELDDTVADQEARAK